MQSALEVLYKHWKIKCLLRQETSGGSRSTWQLANGNWLTRSSSDHSETFKRETSLLELIGRSPNLSSTQLRVPSILKTLSGASLVNEQNSLWRLTKNINGVRARASDPRSYPALIFALDSLHSVLKDISVQSAAVQEGVIESLERLESPDLGHAFIAQAFDWLMPMISSLQKKATITHGDFNPTNVIYEENGNSLKVVGVLDFELSRPDPAVMDYSQLFTMIVCHSGFNDLKSETDKIVSSLSGRFSHEELRLAMLAYWIDLYSRWHKASVTAEEKMRMRLNQVWSFIKLY